ncbi:hypothetical protein NPIL_180391 [Nephila pilipes]|uniref:Uncharacterized protein n=1 Tax=Nephila pilipes TaxID=299642 RepID=A0A8X6T9P1_NEPPI|nr:hypothetical protein NPIL_180391 [Nephila pilipes]
MVSENDFVSEFCGLQIQINQNTTVDWNNCRREVCADSLVFLKGIKTDGAYKIMEIDENLFLHRNYVKVDIMFLYHCGYMEVYAIKPKKVSSLLFPVAVLRP